jgi:hypothetical protein
MDMIKFLNKRKKENRQSLIIDNFNVDSLANRRNSLNSNESPCEIIQAQQNIQTHSLNDNYSEDIKNTEDINNKSYYQKEKENEIFKENTSISRPPIMNRYDKPIMSGASESDYYNSTINSYDNPQPVVSKRNEEHTCNLCHNQNKIKDSFMILTCGHIFHIRCLVDSHYTEANKYGVIDEEYLTSRNCCICSKQMEMEDILYIHNKFYKNTKEYITKQDETIEQLDKQMSKLKEELRICYEYKQKLEHQREKSRQITVTINTMM